MRKIDSLIICKNVYLPAPCLDHHSLHVITIQFREALLKNIARGTTSPEIDSMTWIKFSNNMALLALVAYLATRWRHLYQLQIWPPNGATCISCKFGHQMAPLALVANSGTRWLHLHQQKIWPTDGTTCIGSKFGHHLAPFALFANLATSLHNLHCHIALDCPVGIISQY